MTSAEVVDALEKDLATLRDARVRASIDALRVVPPTPIQLAWDYGEPDATFDGWLVFNDPGHRTGIVYCEQGFGPTHPWGLVATTEACPSMGMDSGWYRRFIEAYLESFSAADVPIWKVVRRTRDKVTREPITEELTGDDAWRIVERLRKSDPAHTYDWEHEISY